jgi:hypothetical protein
LTAQLTQASEALREAQAELAHANPTAHDRTQRAQDAKPRAPIAKENESAEDRFGCRQKVARTAKTEDRQQPVDDGAMADHWADRQTFIGTTTIIPFLPDAWAREAGGFPIMTLPLGFLMKDVLFLAASFYLLKQDLVRAALEIKPSSIPVVGRKK